MERAAHNFLPEGAKLRYQKYPLTPEGVTYTCESCGQEVTANELSFWGETRYSRRKCPCVTAKEERLEAERIRLQVQESRSRHTYRWLGGRWSDLALRERTFENFDRSKQPLAYEAAKIFANDPYGVLVLHGTYGTGKTHLLAAVCNKVLRNERPIESLFTTSPKLFAAIQDRIQRNEEYYSLIDSAVRTPLLVIDDIDKAKWTEFREEIYFSIVDDRIKEGKPVAISTNRLDELATFVGGAVCSRLKTCQIEVEMVGNDYREEI